MKGSNYLKYALGEIVLVVIGILIALSINNWNERRKERDFEERMLKELKVALDNDIGTLENFIGYINIWNNSILSLIDAQNVKNRSTLNMDSIKYHLDKVWGFGVYVVYNNGPYEALKSSGLDKISNDGLRNEIAELYSHDLPSLDVWINEIIRTSIIEKFELFDELFDIKLTRNGSEVNKTLLVENFDFLDSPLFSDILNKSSNTTDSSKSSLEMNIKRMKELSDLISQEID